MGETFKAIPILRLFDEAKAREFYLDDLGFALDWEHRFADGAPLYMQVSRGDLTLHLSEHHGRLLPRRLRLRAHHRPRGAPSRDHRQGLSPRAAGHRGDAWGSRLMQVTDPFNNRLRFDEAGRPPDDAG